MDARVAIDFSGDCLLVSVERPRDFREQSVPYSTALLRPFAQPGVEPWLTELFEFALAYYTVDRLVKRKASWPREFEIKFPAIRFDLWSQASGLVSDMLQATTGDIVHVVPQQRRQQHMHSDDRHLFFSLQSEAPPGIGLLSDGLDSLCGAWSAAKTSSNRYAFLSVLTNPSRMNRIHRVRSSLRSSFGGRIAFHEVDLRLHKPPRYQEQTQRSRTVLALVSGLTVAAGYGSRELDIYENGFGLLNPPAPGLQVPHESSQVLNPAHKSHWSVLARRFLGDVSLNYRNRWYTKGEMCSSAPFSARDLIRCTSSCDSPSRVDPILDCGTCGSCILRKVALATANLTDYDIKYREHYPRRRAFDAATVLPYHARKLLQALDDIDPWPALISLQPTIGPSIDADNQINRAPAIDATLSLIRRQALEIVRWESLQNAA